MRGLRKIFPVLLTVMATSGLFPRSAQSQSTQTQFDAMAQQVPRHANALVLINAEKLFASEVAKSQDWQSQRGKRFESGLTCIPANATRVVIGSQLDLETMRSEWDVAVVDFPTAPSLADVRQHFGGIDDTIAGKPVLCVADDSCVVRFSEQMLGAFGPNSRQLVSSWLQQTDSELSPYLSGALRYEDAGTEVILAIDATDALSPILVKQRLVASSDGRIKNAKIGVEEIARIVSTLKGVMLGITFGKQPFGKIKVDFGVDVTPLSDIAKPLVLDALANHGALIEEMEQWKVEIKGTTVYLSGYLGESGLMRITSLINLPTHALHARAGAAQATAADTSATTQASPNTEQVVLETTQQYFKSVQRLLEDLRSQKGEAHSIGQIGVWFATYANRMDRLPILNVDQQMLQYGQYVEQQLRNCSMAIKGFGINKRVAEVNADSNAAPFGGVLGESASEYYANGAYGRPLGYGAAYGWAANRGAGNAIYAAGRSEMRQAMAARTEVDVQLKAGTATQVRQIMEQLQEAHQKIRVMMTQKYKVEF